MISASAVALSRFFSSKESRSFWKGLASAAKLWAFCMRGREGGRKGGREGGDTIYFLLLLLFQAGREGGREEGNAPTTHVL